MRLSVLSRPWRLCGVWARLTAIHVVTDLLVYWLKFRSHPSLPRVFAMLCVTLLGWMGFRAYGWAGFALAASTIVMWLLLSMSRVLMVLRRSAQQPIGYVDSAVMLHARLVCGMTLLQVVATSHSLGECASDANVLFEEYRWTDGSGAQVQCIFEHGRLSHWELARP